MSDDPHATIRALTDEQRDLREAPPPHDTARLAAIDRELDQAWDLVRRRDAAAEFGGDPARVEPRGENEVEGYLQ